VRDRAAVIPVGRRDERERAERRERGPEVVDVAPLGFVAEPADQQPVDRPRRAQDLEGREAEPDRLVLDQQALDPEIVARMLGRSLGNQRSLHHQRHIRH